MFFQGSLQEGIALAVSQAKAVVCFVRGAFVASTMNCSLRSCQKDNKSFYANCRWRIDDEPLSATWETEYFAGDDEVPAPAISPLPLCRRNA